MNSEIKRVDGRVDTANSNITQTATLIRSEVNKSVTDLDGKISTANSSITQLSNSITSVVNTSIPQLDGRINTAESAIRQQADSISSKVSQSDYNGNMLVSMINQTASHIIISASKISLVGAVSVLSDISGNLGTITAGNINIQNDISVGAAINLRGSNRTGLYFGSWSQIYDNGGRLTIEGYNGVNVIGGTRFSQTVDFSNANVIGLGGNSATTVRYSASSKRLYVDLNSRNEGYIDVI